MIISNTIKTGSMPFTNCKQLNNKMFPSFCTAFNLIISCILYVNYYDIIPRFSIKDLKHLM